MTELLYRLDDDVTASYQEYLDRKNDCNIAFIFRIERPDLDKKYETPKKWSDIKTKVEIPFQNGKFIHLDGVC